MIYQGSPDREPEHPEVFFPEKIEYGIGEIAHGCEHQHGPIVTAIFYGHDEDDPTGTVGFACAESAAEHIAGLLATCMQAWGKVGFTAHMDRAKAEIQHTLGVRLDI